MWKSTVARAAGDIDRGVSVTAGELINLGELCAIVRCEMPILRRSLGADIGSGIGGTRGYLAGADGNAKASHG